MTQPLPSSDWVTRLTWPLWFARGGRRVDLAWRVYRLLVSRPLEVLMDALVRP